MEIADRANTQPRRFVILRHELPAMHPVGSHWDLMFEMRESLFTLRCAKLPAPTTPNERVTLPVTCLENHRLEYLQYEGPVAGNRGTVTRLVSGIYSCQPSENSSVDVLVLEASNLDAILELPACQPGESVEIQCVYWDQKNS